LREIVEAIAAIERHLDRGRTAFEQDELLQGWFVRCSGTCPCGSSHRKRGSRRPRPAPPGDEPAPGRYRERLPEIANRYEVPLLGADQAEEAMLA